MPKKKNPNNNYFNQEVEDAIQLFVNSDNERERNQLFKTIYPAISKIAEVWYNKIKPVYVNLESSELQMECVAFMLEKLPMIKVGKGKAFSYLTVTARNYYILANQRAYASRTKYSFVDASDDRFDIEDLSSDRVEQMEKNAELLEKFIEYVDENFDYIFETKQQKVFGAGLIHKINKDGLSPEFNGRNFLNELTNEVKIPRPIVRKHLNKVASFYSVFKEYYQQNNSKPIVKQKMKINDVDASYIRNNYQSYSKKHGLNGISRTLGINYDVLKNWVKANGII